VLFRSSDPRKRVTSPSTSTTTTTVTISLARRRPLRPPPEATRVLELEPFVLRALAASLALAVVAAPLGSLVIWNRMAYFGETVSQASLIGIALGLALGIDLTAPVQLVPYVSDVLLISHARMTSVPLYSYLLL